jgi:hypothetical protein
MRRTTTLLLTLCVGVIGTATGQDPEARKAFSIPHVLERVSSAIDQPMPEGLSPAEQRRYVAQTEWLESVRNRIEVMGIRTGVMQPRDQVSGRATGRRATQAEVQQEIEALTKAIETESRRFTTLSNVMKARHDVAMNAIRNMKA